MSPTASTWIVVGAGSAGCVVAARMSEDGHRRVILFEAGPELIPGHVPAEIDGEDFLAALSLEDRTWPGVVAARAPGSVPTPYSLGRGVGGCSSVNAMIALRGDREQYASWGWDGVDAAWDAVAVPETRPTDSELGPLDRALLAAADDAVRVPLTRRAGRRVTSAEASLWPALDRPNLEVHADTLVDRVLVADGKATGVRLADGSEHAADRVVVCAGAVHSPAILMRSGIETPGLGDGLQDHPSAALTLRYRDGAAPPPGSLISGTVLRRDDLQILPMNHLGDASAGFGALLVALMRPTGRSGTVRLRDDHPTSAPVVDEQLLSDRSDAERLRTAVRLGLEIASSPPFAELVAEVLIDAHGTSADALVADDEVDRWLRGAMGDYVHASSTCAMGTVVDADAEVVGCDGLHVCDASVFPSIPTVNTHLPTTMLAERMTRRWRSSPTRR